MWGTKANTWSEKEYAAGSMKWHLVDEESLEGREIEIGWHPDHKKKIKRTYGWLDCGRKEVDKAEFDPSSKLPLIIKEKININQRNVCAYCKTARLKEEGLPTVLNL